MAGAAVLSKLLETTVASGIRGSNCCGKPSTTAPTVAEVLGEAEGLEEAVAVGAVLAGAVAVEEEPGSADGVGLQAARAIAAAAARTAKRAGLWFPKSVTGFFLLVLMPESASSLVSTCG
ncbi:hypothetical protein ARTHROSP310_33770 [Arthrobacter sp. AD-310]